jgi:hypothetical protein
MPRHGTERPATLKLVTMSLSSALTAATVVLLFCAACGGNARQTTASGGAGAGAGAGAGTGAGNNSDASAPDAQAEAGAATRGGACGNVPVVPRDHRAVAQACPSTRGSVPLDVTACTDRTGIACARDADCTAGKNGRCFTNGDKCLTVCSYDQCLTDSDCAAGPCVCRSSGIDPSANGCLASAQCRTDADCPNCQYCSPSYISNPADCSPGFSTYACHTARDECTDQSDCSGLVCGYDPGVARWGCEVCVPIQHM